MSQPALLPETNLDALPSVFAGWFRQRGWEPHPHQLEMLAAAATGTEGLILRGA